MKKASRLVIYILSGCLLFSSVGCGIRIDTPESRLLTLNYIQTARLETSLCLNWGLKTAGKPLGINADFWETQLQALGKPDLLWFSGTENQTEIPPLPKGPKVSTDLAKTVQILADCGAQSIADAQHLALATNYKMASEIRKKLAQKAALDEAEADTFNQQKLAKLLFSIGVSLKLKAIDSTTLKNIALTDTKMAEPRIYQYENKRWISKKDPQYKLSLKEKKENLKALILSLDIQRFNTEVALAKANNSALNLRMSSYLNPVILRQIDALVKEHGTDPRLPAYQDQHAPKGTASEIYKQYLQDLLALEFEVLLYSPEPKNSRLAETTMAILREMEKQGVSLPALPGLETKAPVIKTVTDS